MTGPKPKPRTHPISQRIQAWCDQQDISLSKLSVLAGRNRTTAQKMLDNLDGGGDVGTDVLADLADAMGVTLDWLKYGRDKPEVYEARMLPGWTEAVRQAREMFQLSQEELDGAGLVGLPAPPRTVGVWLVHACATVFRMTRTPEIKPCTAASHRSAG